MQDQMSQTATLGLGHGAIHQHPGNPASPVVGFDIDVQNIAPDVLVWMGRMGWPVYDHHAQAPDSLAADTVAVIGTLDIVFGEIDR